MVTSPQQPEMLLDLYSVMFSIILVPFFAVIHLKAFAVLKHFACNATLNSLQWKLVVYVNQILLNI
jgi:hypothetical protein